MGYKKSYTTLYDNNRCSIAFRHFTVIKVKELVLVITKTNSAYQNATHNYFQGREKFEHKTLTKYLCTIIYIYVDNI